MRGWQTVKRWLQNLFVWLARKLNPSVDYRAEVKWLRAKLDELVTKEFQQQRRADAAERIAELVEARQMAGSGPWRVSAQTLADTDLAINGALESIKRIEQGVTLKETGTPIAAQGATGDIELALQNVEWRREINLSWLEFSRWGIQQIILISRLHYIKNPWIQRAINVSAQYIFGRGVEVMSEDDAANDELKDFFERNKKTFGQAALADHQRRLGYDGQVFFVFFADTVDKGKVSARTIDATEIFEIRTDPDDTDSPWLYHRKWTQSVFDFKTGQSQQKSSEAWYPALSWEPTAEQKAQDVIGGWPVMWDQPVLHHKGGTGVSKWHFDCPKAYAALDWAKAGRRWLEACSTVRQALAQIALVLTTKGGQQALEGAKQQLGTTVGPTSSLWDMNPPANIGSTFASGPGTTLAAFNSKGAGGDPSDVREYRSMVACVFEIPPTFLGDLETANLATATTLDRPTELAMLEKQERWREILIMVAIFVLKVSAGAPSGKLREALGSRQVRIGECARKRLPNGRWVYEAIGANSDDIQVKVNFPAIREGDMPANVKAIAEAMTLDNKNGQVVGIDEKIGVGLLYEQFGVEDYGDILDEQYPERATGVKGTPGYEPAYDPSRTKVPLPPPIVKAPPNPGGQPQNPGGLQPAPLASPPPQPVPAPKVAAAERFIHALEAMSAGVPRRR